jgi:hypothetical protein
MLSVNVIKYTVYKKDIENLDFFKGEENEY